MYKYVYIWVEPGTHIRMGCRVDDWANWVSLVIYGLLAQAHRAGKSPARIIAVSHR